MPIFVRDKTKILYIHVPKTGGTSIELFFEKNGFEVKFIDRGGAGTLLPVLFCSPQHMHAKIVEKIFNMNSFNYIFMTVRNPIDRIISEFKMRNSQDVSINEWLTKALLAYRNNPYLLDNHIRPQAEFWLPEADVFKQEDGYTETWVQALASKLNIDFPHTEMDMSMKSSSEAPLRSMIEPHVLQKLRLFYERDFTLFGYEN